ASVAQEEVPVFGIVLRPQCKRLGVEALGGPQRAQRGRAVAGFAEGKARALRKLGRFLARRARQFESARVVVRDDIRQVLSPVACQRLDPFRGEPVLLDPSSTGDLSVGDVTDERVAEDVRGFAGYRRAPLA